MNVEIWYWRFFGFETLVGNRLVQDWFNELPEDARNDARDIIAHLQHLPNHLWRRPEFDQLEDGLSEVRFKSPLNTYRIYGFFGPEGFRRVYTFLHGADKKVRNDRNAKRVARDRMGQLSQQKARVHEFEFN